MILSALDFEYFEDGGLRDDYVKKNKGKGKLDINLSD